MNILEKLEQQEIAARAENAAIPDFGPGDTLRVNVKVVEGTRERIQVFEGVCIARKDRALNSAFTVRKVSYGEGVARIIPLTSPQISSIEAMHRGAARRGKRRYLRGLTGKRARSAEKRDERRPSKKKTAKN